VALVRARPDLTLVPPAALRLSLEEVRGSGSRPGPLGPGGVAGPKGPALREVRRGRSQTAPSWWTTRAREGTIKPGFSKEEILRPAKEDPRASGGVFESVGGVLSELLDQG